MKKTKKLLAMLLACMLLAGAIPAGAEEIAPQPEATEEVIAEVPAEPTEEVIAEATEEVTAEPTEEVTAEATAEPAAEPTEEAPAGAGIMAASEGEPVPLADTDFVIEDGVLVKYNGSASSVTIPDGVKKIGNEAFCTKTSEGWYQSNSTLKSVTIPASVEVIGESAFSACSKLETVNLSEGLEEIGQSAFYNCEKLANITLPQSLKYIEDYAFGWCDSLTSINLPGKLNSLGVGVFSGSGLTEITIPDGTKEIPVFAFDSCKKLEKVVIESDDLKTIGDYAFRDCISLTEIDLPASVESIKYYAFYGCTSLKSVDLPDGLTELASYAFCGSGLAEITVPGSIKSIGGSAFQNCDQLEKAVIRDGVTGISWSAFENCDALTTVVIESDDITSVGGQAFANCPSLKSIQLLGGVKTIGKQAFYKCKGMTELILPEGITEIGDEAFLDCRRLTEVTLPKSVEKIGADIFKDCGDLTVWVHKDSKAHEYCKENAEDQGFTYKLVGGEADDAAGIRPACASFAVNGRTNGSTLWLKPGDTMKLTGTVADVDGDLKRVTVTVQDADDRTKSATLYQAENLPSLSGYSLNGVSAKVGDALGMKPGHTYEIVLWAEDEAGNGLYGGNPEEKWEEYVWKVQVYVQESSSSQPAEKYEVKTSSIRLENKTSGIGYVVLKEGEAAQEDRYVFIQWSWVNKAGDSIVADSCLPLKKLEDGKYSFDAKSVFISGASLQNMVMIVTDDPNAADFSCRNLGAGVLNK